jgi:hypothetical protein
VVVAGGKLMVVARMKMFDEGRKGTRKSGGKEDRRNGRKKRREAGKGKGMAPTKEKKEREARTDIKTRGIIERNDREHAGQAGRQPDRRPEGW